MYRDTADVLFEKLDRDRSLFINRCEQFAKYTLPKICPKTPRKSDQSDESDYQSLGAQGVNHLANKLMLTMFAPSRPFVRLDFNATGQEAVQAAAQMGPDVTEEMLNQVAQIEEAIPRTLDQRAARPALFEVMKHLIITGNVLLHMEDEDAEVFGIKRYVTRRDNSGKWFDCVLRYDLKISELDPELAQMAVLANLTKDNFQPNDDTVIQHYIWLQREPNGTHIKLTKWLNNIQLPDVKFGGRYTVEDCPYHPLMWQHTAGDNYGTGLVEEYKADFHAYSALSKSQVEAAILASEFRWLLNPSGMTKPADLLRSRNGAAIPGSKDDVYLLHNGNAQNLATVQAVAAEYINRIGRGFLLNSAVTRNAERVTAEEIRIQAEELETGLGGAYSRLAVSLQKPVALWLLKDMKLLSDVKKYMDISIVTGLDALSRAGDLWKLRELIRDLASLGAIPAHVLQHMQLGKVISRFVTGHGLPSSEIVISEEQLRQQMAAQQAEQAEAAVNAAATGAETL